jgi:hypothetical protein
LDASSSTFKRKMNCGEKHFLSNLSTLLKWCPFSTEDELLNQVSCLSVYLKPIRWIYQYNHFMLSLPWLPFLNIWWDFKINQLQSSILKTNYVDLVAATHSQMHCFFYLLCCHKGDFTLLAFWDKDWSLLPRTSKVNCWSEE